MKTNSTKIVILFLLYASFPLSAVQLLGAGNPGDLPRHITSSNSFARTSQPVASTSQQSASTTNNANSIGSKASHYGDQILIAVAATLGVELVKECIIPGIKFLFYGSKNATSPEITQSDMDHVRAHRLQIDNNTLKIQEDIILNGHCRDNNSPECQQLRDMLARRKNDIARNYLRDLKEIEQKSNPLSLKRSDA